MHTYTQVQVRPRTGSHGCTDKLHVVACVFTHARFDGRIARRMPCGSVFVVFSFIVVSGVVMFLEVLFELVWFSTGVRMHLLSTFEELEHRHGFHTPLFHQRTRVGVVVAHDLQKHGVFVRLAHLHHGGKDQLARSARLGGDVQHHQLVARTFQLRLQLVLAVHFDHVSRLGIRFQRRTRGAPRRTPRPPRRVHVHLPSTHLRTCVQLARSHACVRLHRCTCHARLCASSPTASHVPSCTPFHLPFACDAEAGGTWKGSKPPEGRNEGDVHGEVLGSNPRETRRNPRGGEGRSGTRRGRREGRWKNRGFSLVLDG